DRRDELAAGRSGDWQDETRRDRREYRPGSAAGRGSAGQRPRRWPPWGRRIGCVFDGTAGWAECVMVAAERDHHAAQFGIPRRTLRRGYRSLLREPDAVRARRRTVERRRRERRLLGATSGYGSEGSREAVRDDCAAHGSDPTPSWRPPGSTYCQARSRVRAP